MAFLLVPSMFAWPSVELQRLRSVILNRLEELGVFTMNTVSDVGFESMSNLKELGLDKAYIHR